MRELEFVVQENEPMQPLLKYSSLATGSSHHANDYVEAIMTAAAQANAVVDWSYQYRNAITEQSWHCVAVTASMHVDWIAHFLTRLHELLPVSYPRIALAMQRNMYFVDWHERYEDTQLAYDENPTIVKRQRLVLPNICTNGIQAPLASIETFAARFGVQCVS